MGTCSVVRAVHQDAEATTLRKQHTARIRKYANKFALSTSLLIFALLRVGFPQASADEALYHFPKIEKHLIKSKSIDQTYEIHVMLPVSKKDGSESFPVLYMTDANAGIPISQMTRNMQVAGEIPRFIVVGIGYPVDTVFNSLYLRERDLTPTQMERPLYNLPIEGIVKVKKGKKSGGAAEFLRFIRTQLKPFIDERYNTVPNDTGYFGHSLGGLFGLYVLFHEPEAFNRYIIGSPAIWWDNEIIFSYARKFLEAYDSLDAAVYMAVGGMEERIRPKTRWVSNVNRLDAVLQSKTIEGFSLETEVFPEEAHISVFSMLHSRGLRAVYGPAEWPPFRSGDRD